MVRGLIEPWKHAVGYILSSGYIPSDKLSSLVLECISKLQDIGLTAKVMLCNQGSNNRSMIDKLTKLWRHVLLSIQTSVHQATFEVSKVHTQTYIYIVKAKVVYFFFGYLYKKTLLEVHTRPYTNAHTPSHFLGFKGPYTNLYLYSKKLKMSILWLLI